MIGRIFDLVSQIVDKFDYDPARQAARIENRNNRKELRLQRRQAKKERKHPQINTLFDNNVDTSTTENKVMDQRIEGFIRHLLSAVGPWLIYKGYINEEQYQEFTAIALQLTGSLFLAFAFLRSFLTKQSTAIAAMGIGFPFFSRRRRTFNIEIDKAGKHFAWLIQQKEIQDKLYATDPNNNAWGTGQIYGAIRTMRTMFPTAINNTRHTKGLVNDDVKELNWRLGEEKAEENNYQIPRTFKGKPRI